MLKEPIKWSQKFISVYGDLLFKELAKREEKVSHYWLINSNDETMTEINEWLQKQASSVEAKAVVKAMGWDKDPDKDYVMKQILLYVRSHIQYKRDSEVHSLPEYWQTVNETLELQTGDCEDGAVLILILGHLSHVRPAQLRLRWGRVVGGGHAYVVYRRFYDGVEVILDWCYWFTPIIIKLRKWLFKESNYLEAWGSARLKEE